MWACSRKVEAGVAGYFCLIISPVMSKNSNRNNTSTHYKAIIQFWRLSIANQGKSNIDKNTYELLNLRLFLL